MFLLLYFLFFLSNGIDLSYITSDNTLVSYQSDSMIEIIDQITTKSNMVFIITSFGETPTVIKEKQIELEGIEIQFRFFFQNYLNFN